jgi:hypothetical protein
MKKSKLLQNLDTAWTELQSSYAGLSDEEMVQPCTIGEWSIKDIIAHVTSWEDEALKHLPTILAGKRPLRYSVTYGGIDAFNAQVMAQKKTLSLTEILRQRDETHHQLIDFIQQVPEEQVMNETRFRRRLRLDTYSHYPIHAEAIRNWQKVG